jgi:hypothetical protein
MISSNDDMDMGNDENEFKDDDQLPQAIQATASKPSMTHRFEKQEGNPGPEGFAQRSTESQVHRPQATNSSVFIS